MSQLNDARISRTIWVAEQWEAPSSDDKTRHKRKASSGVYGHNKQLKIWKKIRCVAPAFFAVKKAITQQSFFIPSRYVWNWIITPEITLSSTHHQRNHIAARLRVRVAVRARSNGRKTWNAHLRSGHFHQAPPLNYTQFGLNRCYWKRLLCVQNEAVKANDRRLGWEQCVRQQSATDCVETR